ncbi:Threonine dehydratase biosynthetic [Roseibacterium elongatum DSM 19469]|uniref:L-threonine dehydratase n=1 Tax=Roseicyclus elongatus DSM 19469 TaxID=1294273 RepID=W8SLY9_9RHOB|nr:threonine ammonia-lyase IlvA [Roseibacterium elongatum]AHM03550.1 Threonine dehydratase biosynthetic [Roseibacterium elongatum DSM 19469]
MTEFSDTARAATEAVRDLFPPTPLQRNVHLSERFGADIWLKREDLSPVRSYKIRGAFNAMRKVLAQAPEKRKFVCASAGNHAQGVAFVCAHFGVEGTIFMPVTTPEQKIMKTRRFGGGAVTIELTGDFFDDTLAAAKAYCQQTGAHFLSPFDDPDVIEGQASVAVELLDDMGAVPDRLILPVGGGGLSAGMLSYFHAVGAETKVTLVEPVGGPSLTAALRIGAPQTIEITDTFVDGAAVARIGDRTFEVLKSVAPADVLLAPENRICVTIQEMLNGEGIVLEPAGALALDVLEDLRPQIAGQTVVCVTSGGNFDFERLPEVKERAMNWQGLKKYFILRLPQRPGALRDFLDLLGTDDNITRFEYLKKNSRNFGSVLIGIETSDAANFPSLFERVNGRGFTFRDVTDDEVLADFLI